MPAAAVASHRSEQLNNCWTIKKHWNNKFYYKTASCWFFLWDLYYDARIHEHQVSPSCYEEVEQLYVHNEYNGLYWYNNIKGVID